MTHSEMIEVIKAHHEGKKIQYYNKLNHEWSDCFNNDPCWDFSTHEYRIKPEKRTRPYKGQDECWSAMQKHHPLGWVKHKASGSFVFLSEISNSYDFENLLKYYVYLDGSPLGISEK